MGMMTGAQLQSLLKHRGDRTEQIEQIVGKVAKAVRHDSGGLNKTETRFKTRLESLRVRKLIQDFSVHPWAFKLAHDCRLTLDFLVVENDGTLTLYDVKGREMEDAVIKMRFAAEVFWYFRFRMIEEVVESSSWHVTRRFNDDESVADIS